MLLADRVVLPVNLALDIREEGLDCIGVALPRTYSPSPLFTVSCEENSLPMAVDRGVISYQLALAAGLRDQYIANRLRRNVRHVLGANLFAALESRRMPKGKRSGAPCVLPGGMKWRHSSSRMAHGRQASCGSGCIR